LGNLRKSIGGKLAIGGASFLAAYGSARSSYQPQPPAPEFGQLIDWVAGFNDPLAIALIAVTAITTGISIWQAITGLSKSDVEEVVTQDGSFTREHVDEAIAQTWVEGQASEARDHALAERQDEQTRLLNFLVEKEKARQSGRDEQFRLVDAKLVMLARKVVEKVDDPQQALLILEDNIETYLEMLAERARGSNFGAAADAAFERVLAMVDAGHFSDAVEQGEREYLRLEQEERDLAERMAAQKLRMVETNIDAARLAVDAKNTARWLAEKSRLESSKGELSATELRLVRRTWYERAELRGSRFDMDVAIELARRSIEAAQSADIVAVCQNDLGNALTRQGERQGSEAGLALLDEAVAAYRAALEVHTRAEMPVQWAMTV